MTAWWQDAVVYEIYVRSFADSDGDGVGDLPGVLARLDHVAGLGVDAIWLTPFYPSPMADHGYDVADYCDVDATFGTLDDFDRVLAAAHARGLRVYVDIVPNHTSREHPWFRAAVADPTSAYRDYYVFRPPRADGRPPNDWQSGFGGSAWTRDETSGEFYLHLFDAAQPDLNWRNPAVHREFERILRFWLDRGVDGFRIDVAHALMKDPLLRDGSEHAGDHDDVLAIWQEWRRFIDNYAGRAFVGEVFLYDADRVAEYVGPDRLHQAFNFTVAKTPFTAEDLRETLAQAVELFARPGSTPTWVLSNHDLVRHPTRYGGGVAGERRGRAVTAMLLALPGSPYLYQGEELGLEQSDVPPERRRDPVYLRSGRVGRDGCRTPLPWTSERPGHGFTAGEPWLPFDAQAATRNVTVQARDDRSTLAFYRRALAIRKQLRPELAGVRVQWPAAPADVVVAVRPLTDGSRLVVLLNAGDDPRAVPVDGSVAQLLTSGEDARVDAGEAAVVVPGETTAWLRVTGGSAALQQTS